MKTTGSVTQVTSEQANDLIAKVIEEIPDDEEMTPHQVAQIALGMLIMFRLVRS